MIDHSFTQKWYRIATIQMAIAITVALPMLPAAWAQSFVVIDYISFDVSGPTLKSTYGNVLSREGGSQQVTIEYTLKNVEVQRREKPVIAMTEVRDRDGSTYYLALQTVDLAPGETGTIGTSWLLPKDAQAGDVYQIRFFMLASLVPDPDDQPVYNAVIKRDIRVDSTMPLVIVQMFQ